LFVNLFLLEEVVPEGLQALFDEFLLDFVWLGVELSAFNDLLPKFLLLQSVIRDVEIGDQAFEAALDIFGFEFFGLSVDTAALGLEILVVVPLSLIPALLVFLVQFVRIFLGGFLFVIFFI